MGKLDKLSVFISLVLRHNPDAANIKLDEHGWADVEELIAGIQRTGRAIDMAILEEIVATDNKQRYVVLRRIGCDEKIINKSLFRQICIFFAFPLILAIIHSIFGIQFVLSMMSSLANPSELLPSVMVTVIIIGVVYGVYFIATYMRSKSIIKEN